MIIACPRLDCHGFIVDTQDGRLICALCAREIGAITNPYQYEDTALTQNYKTGRPREKLSDHQRAFRKAIWRARDLVKKNQKYHERKALRELQALRS